MNVERINELAHKAKTVGLTEAEKEEQSKLRTEYIESVRANLRAQLENIDIQEPDGTVINVGERYREKHKKQ